MTPAEIAQAQLDAYNAQDIDALCRYYADDVEVADLNETPNLKGVAGYREKQGQVTQAREKIEAGARALGFEILGKPQLGIVAFRHPDVASLAVWSKLRERGWFASLTTEPQSLHLMLSPFHAQVADQYLADLAWALGEARSAAPTATKEVRYS